MAALIAKPSNDPPTRATTAQRSLAVPPWPRPAASWTPQGTKGGGSRRLCARLRLLVQAPEHSRAGDDADHDPEILPPPRRKVDSSQDEAGAENARGDDQPSPRNVAELGIGDQARRRVAPCLHGLPRFSSHPLTSTIRSPRVPGETSGERRLDRRTRSRAAGPRRARRAHQNNGDAEPGRYTRGEHRGR